MLMNMGWEEGTGLGSKQQGITAPVNKYVSYLLVTCMLMENYILPDKFQTN